MRPLTRLFKRKPQPSQVDVLTGYAQWAKNYPAHAHNPLMEIEERAMLSLLPADLSGQVCLDLACGSGRYMRLMQSRQARRVFGVDYSPEMLSQAINSEPKAHKGQFRASAKSPLREGPLWAIQSQCEAPLAGRPPVGNSYRKDIPLGQLARSTFLALPFAAATFDTITCGLAIGHEKNLKWTLAEISRVLRPGGVVVYSDFHPFGTLSGWQRSFTTANGATFNLEHYLHLYSHHHQACEAAGLAIKAVVEPIAGEHAPPGFQQMPVVLVIQAYKDL